MLQWHARGGTRGIRCAVIPKQKHIMGDVPQLLWLWCISYFLIHGNSDKIDPKHNKFLNSRKSYAIPHFTQRLCRWVFSGLCRLLRHKPFNLHYFRPYLFWQYLKKSCLSHFPNKAQIFHYGNYLDFALKIAHRGNTGSHRGKRKLGCVSEK